MELTTEQQNFIHAMAEKRVRPELISSSFQRQFRQLLTARQIQDYLKSREERAEGLKAARDIQNKLGNHEEVLSHVRGKLLELFDDDRASVNERVNLAKEIRANIGTTQDIARMVDERGEDSVVLVIGEQKEEVRTIDEPR